MSCLDGMKLSGPQRKAVLDDHSEVLVAAGAGSGKTRLLVAYFLRALIDEGLRPEQLIAVTFTRKAAAELVGRIRSELERLGRTDLSRSLAAATVGTIHGLCRRLIMEQALEAGVDPAGSVLEAEAAELIKDQISREVWASVLERATDEQLDVLARGGERLRKQIVPLYDRLRGMGHESPQIAVSETASAADLEVAGRGLVETARTALAVAAARVQIGVALRKDLDRLEQCLAWMRGPAGPEERAMSVEETASFYPSKSTPSVEACFEPVRAALLEYRQALARIRLRQTVAVMNLLLDVFHSSYSAHKLERGLLDFADLELYARLLAFQVGARGNSVLPPGSVLLIDEFQDTNALQYGILSSLGASKTLMVGDERQSIYRFRGADVRVFREREAALEGAEGEETSGRVYRLDENYRSRPEILGFINHLFGSGIFFGEDHVPLAPPEESAGAAVGSQYDPASPIPEPALASPAVEVVVVGRRAAGSGEAVEGMQQAEANEIAARIRRLIDTESWRQGQIALLLPSQTYVDVYQQALLARGIDVYVVGGKGYYSQEEVTDVIALLRLLVNPHDDLALVAALRSPLAGISDDALYLIGNERRRTRASLWEAVRAGEPRSLPARDAERLSLFTSRLLGLRRRVGRPGLARLIDEAVSVCDYDLCLLSASQGTRRFANVRKMMRMASEYEELEGPDLAGFIALLESLDNLSDREGSAPTLAEGQDVVCIMTVHQAKGLEFPVVVLAGLGSDVRTTDATEFMVGDDGRMGVFLRGSRKDRYEEQDLSWGPATQILVDEQAKEREEDVRLLYVAMTRAEKRLILVGGRPRGEKLETSRIGRVLQGLGFATMPEEGDTLLPGLDAVVTVAGAAQVVSAESQAAEVTSSKGAGRAQDAARRPEAPDLAPCFLALAPGDRGPRRVSFSELAAYQSCPLGYYLERVLRLESDPVVDSVGGRRSEDDEDVSAIDDRVLDVHEQSSGRDVGLLVHALLERLPAAESPPADEALIALADAWLKQTATSLSPADRERALALTRAFWDSPVAGLRAAPGALQEAAFLFAQRDVVVSGVMDLLLPGGADGVWHIVDYKTNALGARTAEEVFSSYKLQADMYCLAALKRGAPAVQMDFVFLERPREPVRIRYDAAEMGRLGAIVDEALEELRQSRFDRCVGDRCCDCGVRDVCTMMAPVSPDGIQ